MHGDAFEAAVGGHIVRRRLAEFEHDFNRGAVSSLIAQYDKGFVGILGPEILDYDEYTKRVREMVEAAERPSFKMDVHSVYPLDKSHVVANGFVYTTYANRSPDKDLFTVIYGQFGAEWKLVYSHSSSL